MEAMKCLRVVAALLLCGCTLWCGVNGETCTQTGTPCQCSLGDGQTMDITGISTTPGFQSFPDAGRQGYVYAYGPCGQVLNNGDDCVPANNPGGCEDAGGSWVSLGRTDQLTIDVNTTANPVTSTWSYTGGSDGREFVATITCDPTQTPGTIVDDGEHPLLTYNFVLATTYGCLSGGPGPGPVTTQQPPPARPSTSPSSNDGISPGSIMMIVCFVIAIMYVIGGVLLMRFHRGATGLEMVPNRELWTAIPGLIKDGVLFIASPCRSQSGDYETL